jgi:hypothetical protein
MGGSFTSRLVRVLCYVPRRENIIKPLCTRTNDKKARNVELQGWIGIVIYKAN